MVVGVEGTAREAHTYVKCWLRVSGEDTFTHASDTDAARTAARKEGASA